MIQRKQTLFLLELIFLGIALLFVPAATLLMPDSSQGVCLLPLPEAFTSTIWHTIAMALNFAALLLAFISIFLYKKRELQIRLCYVILLVWLVITFIITLMPLVKTGNNVTSIHTNYPVAVIGLFAVLAAYLAARFIRKDIELLKSADRI